MNRADVVELTPLGVAALDAGLLPPELRHACLTGDREAMVCQVGELLEEERRHRNDRPREEAGLRVGAAVQLAVTRGILTLRKCR